jgi:UDP-N-acetylglucosamine--N-acetylmuramyl-(pentapeptide) pyrophosphoryl-undecaprenol N-acetylglucosamine transferase
MRVGEQRLNAGPAVAAGVALLVDNTDLDNGLDRDQPDPGAHRSRADRRDVGPRVGGRAPNADVALARHVLTAVAERRRLVSGGPPAARPESRATGDSS